MAKYISVIVCLFLGIAGEPPSRRFAVYPSPSSEYGVPGQQPSAAYGAPQRPSYSPGQYSGSRYNGYRGNGNDDGPYEPANYQFSYDVLAPEYGTEFGHQESRQGDVAQGKYYVVLPDGRTQKVEYVADQDGYHPRISYEGGGNGFNKGPQNFGSGGY